MRARTPAQLDALARNRNAQSARRAAARPRLTPAQFDALATLSGEIGTPSRRAARLVLVDGWRPSDAAEATDVSRAAVTNAVQRTVARLALCRTAAGVAP